MHSPFAYFPLFAFLSASSSFFCKSGGVRRPGCLVEGATSLALDVKVCNPPWPIMEVLHAAGAGLLFLHNIAHFYSDTMFTVSVYC